MSITLAPGVVRDAITRTLSLAPEPMHPADIHRRIEQDLGVKVPTSSVRSYLSLNQPRTFIRVERGKYALATSFNSPVETTDMSVAFTHGQVTLHHSDCLTWLKEQEPNSIHAVVTDPPYGPEEYSQVAQEKLRAGRGGTWRIPPALGGFARSPLPRFTTVDSEGRAAMRTFFTQLGTALLPVLTPGAHVFVACNPLFSHLVGTALASSGLERRGEIVRLVMTLRGGDRPKNAHEEFKDVTVMPRSMWEPWLLFRKPLEGTVSQNLRKWGTGGLRRPSDDRPFGDVIQSSPTRTSEKKLAPHPSLKPQAFLRSIVQASLPLGEGIVLDPFAGSGSTLAAAEAVGYKSVGMERDKKYFELAQEAIPKLAAYKVKDQA